MESVQSVEFIVKFEWVKRDDWSVHRLSMRFRSTYHKRQPKL